MELIQHIPAPRPLLCRQHLRHKLLEVAYAPARSTGVLAQYRDIAIGSAQCVQHIAAKINHLELQPFTARGVLPRFQPR
jgi:hypothetical protein